MAVNTGNLVQGPATLYTAAFGTTEPTDANVTSAPGVGWTDVGGTSGGVDWEADMTYKDLMVDQLIDPAGARATARKVTVTTKLSEVTLANLNLVMNGLMTVAANSGYTTADPQTVTSASQPTYAALLIDGWAPTLASGSAARRRLIVRKVLAQTKAKLTYDLQNQALYEVTFQAYYVSSSIPLFHVVDQTA